MLGGFWGDAENFLRLSPFYSELPRLMAIYAKSRNKKSVTIDLKHAEGLRVSNWIVQRLYNYAVNETFEL